MNVHSVEGQDLFRTTLAVVFIVGLIGASAWILSPFLGALIWATMIVVSSWRGMLQIQALLWNKRWLAATVVTAAFLLLLFTPVLLTIAAIVEHGNEALAWLASLKSLAVPAPPPWLASVPVVGPMAHEFWQQTAASGLQDMVEKAMPYASTIGTWLAERVGGIGWIALQSLITVAIVAILYVHGERAAEALLRFGQRLAGERGANAIRLAGRAIRAVALGVVVTALAQSVLGGIGLAISGVPLAALLSGVMFLLCIAQLGPVLVLAPAVVWLYWSGDAVWGTVLLIWTVVVGVLDNVLRPVLIKRGADLPLLLILVGVIGGLIGFGLVGIFAGPIVLAVSYTLLDAWIHEEPDSSDPPSAG